MKTKLTLFLLSLTLVLVVYFTNRFNSEPIKIPEKAGMTIIKCSSDDYFLNEFDSTRQVAPVIDNLGDHHFKIKTTVSTAQSFFNQGLNLCYAFNHAESHRSFLEASRLDPSAAMSFWGQAYVLGPNINDQIPDTERRIKSYEAVQKASELSKGLSDLEKDLIDALLKRYSPDTTADISELNLDYMNAMTEVKEKYPQHPDVLTFYAASVMNTTPWNYWSKEGNPMPNIKEAKEALERAIELNPEHPGAHHYYIHMVELPKPDEAVPSAEKLAHLMPGAGHMVHMPGHIFMRVGRYDEAVKANQDAILVDENYISQCYAQGIYPLGYYPHNIHFLWSAASMMANEELAIDAAKKTAEKVPYSGLEGNYYYQRFASTPILAYLRFGKWNDILSYPDPGSEYRYLSMIRTYARGIAFLRKDNLKEAREELEFLSASLKENDSSELTQVARAVVSGEIQAYQKNYSAAIKDLVRAVQLEDELPYDEPSRWYIPTRQSLGSVLLKAGKYAEAEKTFREDLDYYRSNIWSLTGLVQSLEAQGKHQETEQFKLDLERARKHSDIVVEEPVF